MNATMNDVDRLFQYLVSHLAKDHPDYLERPFQVSELYQRLIPYRYHRDGLGFDTIEDYEFAILRLLAGERGYATVEPEDAQRAMAEEVALSNPTPGAFREYAAATMTLSSSAVRRFVAPEVAYAPPGSKRTTVPFAPPAGAATAPISHEPTAPPSPPAPKSVPAAPPRTSALPTDPTLPVADLASLKEVPFEHVEGTTDCPGCSELLPVDRDVGFCPFCGLRIGVAPCRECGEPLQPDWRFCVACGRPYDA